MDDLEANIFSTDTLEVAHMVALSVDTVTVDIAIAITEVIMDSVLDIKDFLIMEFHTD